MTKVACENCAYWGDVDDEDIDLLGTSVRECRKAVMFWDATEWVDRGNDYHRKLLPKYEGQKMFVQDGSDYMATLLTLPDFYCAHFDASTENGE